jgi:hypothetical protein
MSRNKRVTIVVTAFGLWLVGTTWGMDVLLHHASTPGAQEAAPADWPVGTTVERRPGNQLVVFAHPLCPCTAATVEELDRIMAATAGRLAATVVFFVPAKDGAWSEGGLAAHAAKIPGVTIIDDVGGEEARRFGAVTSGDTFLYDAGGRLVFRGGITSSRGHAGDSPGKAAIESFVLEGRHESAKAPVFGCAIRRNDREQAE